MDYVKKPLSIATQVSKLEKRGLIIDDKSLAEKYLSNISYYRLRAYTYPFQDNSHPQEDHRFLTNDIHLTDVLNLYCFDRRLRTLVFNAIEKIEVAVRTKIIQIYSEHYDDGHWFCDSSNYREGFHKVKNGVSVSNHIWLMDSIKSEIDRSNEDFIEHYNEVYKNPPIPPAWMTLEVLSMGTLSQLYQILLLNEQKKAVARAFGITDVKMFENWLHGLSVLRNYCAHHSRIWNRRFIIEIILPYYTLEPFIPLYNLGKIRKNKIFAYLSVIKYILDIISPASNFKVNLQSIIGDAGKLLKLSDMGFIENWECFPVWEDK